MCVCVCVCVCEQGCIQDLGLRWGKGGGGGNAIRECIGVQRLGGGGGGGVLQVTNATCVVLQRCVLLLGVWGHGPQENNCFVYLIRWP